MGFIFFNYCFYYLRVFFYKYKGIKYLKILLWKWIFLCKILILFDVCKIENSNVFVIFECFYGVERLINDFVIILMFVIKY